MKHIDELLTERQALTDAIASVTSQEKQEALRRLVQRVDAELKKASALQGFGQDVDQGRYELEKARFKGDEGTGAMVMEFFAARAAYRFALGLHGQESADRYLNEVPQEIASHIRAGTVPKF